MERDGVVRIERKSLLPKRRDRALLKDAFYGLSLAVVGAVTVLLRSDVGGIEALILCVSAIAAAYIGVTTLGKWRAGGAVERAPLLIDTQLATVREDRDHAFAPVPYIRDVWLAPDTAASGLPEVDVRPLHMPAQPIDHIPTMNRTLGAFRGGIEVESTFALAASVAPAAARDALLRDHILPQTTFVATEAAMSGSELFVRDQNMKAFAFSLEDLRGSRQMDEWFVVRFGADVLYAFYQPSLEFKNTLLEAELRVSAPRAHASP